MSRTYLFQPLITLKYSNDFMNGIKGKQYMKWVFLQYSRANYIPARETDMKL